MSDRPDEPEAAIAGTSMGGAMDLGVDEAETLEKATAARTAPDRRTGRARCGRTPGGTCAATPCSSSPRWSSCSWSSSPCGRRRSPPAPLKCDLSKAQEGSQPGHPFGFDGQGCDVYTRTVYGARTSVTVGVLATLGVAVLGSVLGALAGFFGGLSDSVLSRITDVFFAIPVVLGGLVLLSVITSNTVWPVIGFIVLLGWPQISRIARGAVITAKQNDYVQAARALGASNSRLLLRHIAPNAVAPVIVVATIALGTYIALEATLSYLGVGLKPPSVSWGIDISSASPYIRNAPHALLWPSGALAITVLAFIMLGDAVRDALDPKLR